MSIPKGQKWLIDRVKALGYRSNDSGICYGEAIVGMLAELVDELPRHHRRLELMAEIPVPQFAQRIEELQQKRLQIIQKTKSRAAETFKELTLPALQLSEIIHQEYLNKIWNNIKQNPEIKEEDKKNYYDQIKNKYLFDVYAQNLINKKLSELPEDEQILIEVPAFFDALELAFQAYRYPYLFPKGKAPDRQDFEMTLPLIESHYLERKKSATFVNQCIGAYDANELLQYLQSLKKSITNQSTLQNFNLILISYNHVISLAIHPKENSRKIIEANYLELLSTDGSSMSMEKLVSQIFQSFRGQNHILFITQMYCTNDNKKEIQKLDDEWRRNQYWKKIHELSLEKSLLTDSFNRTLLNLAIKNKEIEATKYLLQFNSDDINRNVKETNGELVSTPLMQAVATNQIEIIHMLLDFPNINVNTPTSIGGSALFLAAQSGLIEIVKLLLAHHADMTLPLTNTIIALRDFAKTNQVEDKMEALIAAKNPENKLEKISITPAEIATIMGHDDIAEVINAAEEEKSHQVNFRIMQLINVCMKRNKFNSEQVYALNHFINLLLNKSHENKTIREIYVEWKNIKLNSGKKYSDIFSKIITNTSLFSLGYQPFKEIIKNFAEQKPKENVSKHVRKIVFV